MTPGERRELDEAARRAGMSRSAYVRALLSRKEGEDTSMAKVEIPVSRAAALAEAIERLGRGDVSGALAIRDAIPKDVDTLARDAADWWRWFHRQGSTRPSAFWGADTVHEAATVIERELASRQGRGRMDTGTMMRVLMGGSEKLGEGGWSGPSHGSGFECRGLPNLDRHIRSGSFQGVGDFVALGTDIFGEIVADTIPKAGPAAAAISATVTMENFREKQISIFAGIDPLLETTSGAEIEHGVIHDRKVTTDGLTSFRRKYTVSRAALMGSHQGLKFRDWPEVIGREISRLISDHVIGALTSSAEFTAGNGNLAGTPSAITAGKISDGWAAITGQTAPAGGPQGFRPGWLLCPESKLLTATAAVRKVSPGDEPILRVMSDPRVSGNQWYMGVSPDEWPAIVQIVMSEDHVLPTVQTMAGFAVEGIRISAAYDLGAALTIPRGLWKNLGA